MGLPKKSPGEVRVDDSGQFAKRDDCAADMQATGESGSGKT